MKKLLAMLLVLCLTLGLGLGIVSASAEDVTLKFLISAGFYDLENDLGWKVCQRVSGYKIDYEVINGTEQLMLIITSGQEYDYTYLNSKNYSLMMSEGALMDITDLLNEYGQNILAAFPTTWPAVTTDGRIYAIPSPAAQPDSLTYSMIARKDLLDKIGYTEYPTTVEGFVKMLEDIKAAYPDMVPLTASRLDAGVLSNVASAFNVQGMYQLVDGKVINIVDNPNLKACGGHPRPVRPQAAGRRNARHHHQRHALQVGCQPGCDLLSELERLRNLHRRAASAEPRYGIRGAAPAAG